MTVWTEYGVKLHDGQHCTASTVDLAVDYAWATCHRAVERRVEHRAKPRSGWDADYLPAPWLPVEREAG
jgi:hypothetical protein